ncbi:unnamed protein product [Caenorhabditis brenneri]
MWRGEFSTSNCTSLLTKYLMKFLLLLAITTVVAVSAQGEFKIRFVSKQECDAGDTPKEDVSNGGTKASVANSKYIVKEAYIFWTNQNGKILGMAVCKVPASKTCDGEKASPTGAAKTYLAVAVTLKQSSFEDQNIHYQYFDELFGLSKIEEPGNSNTGEIHKLNNFLFVESASYKKQEFNGGDCRKNRAKSLISGHGYFITEFKKNKEAASWENLYYLPHRIGQYITTPN